MPIKRPTATVKRRVRQLKAGSAGVRGYAYPADTPLVVEAATDRVLLGSARLAHAAPTLPCWLVKLDAWSADSLAAFDRTAEPLPSQFAAAALALHRAGLLLTEVQTVLGFSDVTTTSRWAAVAALPAKVLDLLDRRQITFGHARLLIGLPESKASHLVGECVAHGWTNDRLRQAIRGEPAKASPDTSAFADNLTQRLGTQCSLQWPDNPGKRRLVIEYFDTEALKGVLEQLARGPEGPRRNVRRVLEIAVQDADELDALTGHLGS